MTNKKNIYFQQQMQYVLSFIIQQTVLMLADEQQEKQIQ